MSLVALTSQEFGDTVEPYRRELQAHCYRMFGSLQDAEDVVQETFLRAWKRRENYVEEGALRAWLYRIATNLCIDSLKRSRRRHTPKTLEHMASALDSIPPPILDPIWLEPYPDELYEREDNHPEQQVLIHESISIAFLTALQQLPPRQRAVLLLSDVLEWPARDIADLLQTTGPAVKSALHRARSKMDSLEHSDTIQPDNLSVSAQLVRYIRAWETADIDEFIALLREEATFSMPPTPSWYRGTATIRQLVSNTVFSGEARGRWKLLPTRANGHVAFGLYRQAESGGYDAYGIQVLTFSEELVSDVITFRVPQHVSSFRLPMHIEQTI